MEIAVTGYDLNYTLSYLVRLIFVKPKGFPKNRWVLSEAIKIFRTQGHSLLLTQQIIVWMTKPLLNPRNSSSLEGQMSFFFFSQINAFFFFFPKSMPPWLFFLRWNFKDKKNFKITDKSKASIPQAKFNIKTHHLQPLLTKFNQSLEESLAMHKTPISIFWYLSTSTHPWSTKAYFCTQLIMDIISFSRHFLTKLTLNTYCWSVLCVRQGFLQDPANTVRGEKRVITEISCFSLAFT